nr:hypothetical protein [Tanacetum cinerariifolium]
LVDDHLDTRIGATREEFMNFLLASLTERITKQVKDQLPQILPEEVSNFALPVIEKMIEAKAEKIRIKMKARPLDQIEGLRSKDAEPTIGPKSKDSTSGSSKGIKSQPKSSGKNVQSEVPEFEVAESYMPQDQGGNLVTRVNIIKKHGYGYLREIEVRRADNLLYTFKEGDFPRLRLNDIEDTLILRVRDLQLGVESYQKKINVTRPDTVRPDIWKRYPYTPYQDPQGFIYVDSLERNMLMCSDELYKFNDGTLTRLLTSLEDITKNIHIRYLPKRRCSSLKKKIAHFMIKEINKFLKERRMMRSVEKFVGGRLYDSDPRLLQRTI